MYFLLFNLFHCDRLQSEASTFCTRGDQTPSLISPIGGNCRCMIHLGREAILTADAWYCMVKAKKQCRVRVVKAIECVAVWIPRWWCLRKVQPVWCGPDTLHIVRDGIQKLLVSLTSRLRWRACAWTHFFKCCLANVKCRSKNTFAVRFMTKSNLLDFSCLPGTHVTHHWHPHNDFSLSWAT